MNREGSFKPDSVMVIWHGERKGRGEGELDMGEMRWGMAIDRWAWGMNGYARGGLFPWPLFSNSD